MFAKMSLRDRLDCLVDFVGMILLPVVFLLPLPNCFLRVCFPTLFAAVLKFFLPLTTAISGTANSNMSAPMRFAAGTTYLRRKGIAVLPITCRRAPKPLSLCLPTALYYGRQIQRVFFHQMCLSDQCVYYEKSFGAEV